jgi:hypothetical protein
MTENTKIPAAQNSNNAIDSDPSDAEKGYAVPAIMTENANQKGAQQKTAQNPKETPSKSSEGAYQTMSHSSGNVQGVDTATGSQAKGMGSDGYTKHRFNETPGNGGNGGNGGNSSGSGDGGDGDATKVGSAYWQF